MNNKEIIEEFNNTFPLIPTESIFIFIDYITYMNIDPDYWDIWFKLQKHENNDFNIIKEHFEQIEIFINWYLSTKKNNIKKNHTHKQLKNVFHKH